MKTFTPRSTFDKLFETGIILKGLDGLVETIVGFALFWVNPEHINHLVKSLTSSVIQQNPHDLIATHLLHWSQQLTKGALLFGAIYLLAHGVAKLVLVIEILRNHLWAYPALIVLTAVFVVYQSYEIIYSHSISLILLTIFDLVIIYLTTHEYRKQKIVHQKTS